MILTKSSVNCIQIICIAHDEKMNVNREIKSAIKPMRPFEIRMMDINKIYLLQIFKRDSFCNSLCFFYTAIGKCHWIGLCEVVQVFSIRLHFSLQNNSPEFGIFAELLKSITRDNDEHLFQ